MTYASAFKSVGISSKNADVGYIHIFHKGCPNTSKNAGTGFESAGTYPSAFEKRWYKSA